MSYFSVFTRESSYCFQRVLALSVCLSVTRVDQSKTSCENLATYLLEAIIYLQLHYGIDLCREKAVLGLLFHIFMRIVIFSSC